MNSLSVVFMGLLLGIFIPHSLQMQEYKTWEAFKPIMQGGGPIMLALYKKNTGGIETMQEYCAQYPKVNCVQGFEDIENKDDSFFKQFHNAKTMTLVFFNHGAQTAMLVGSAQMTRDNIKAEFAKISA